MVLLREVDELEVARERARDGFGAVEVEAADGVEHRALVPLRGVIAEPDRRFPEPLDVGEQLLTSRLLDRAS